MKESDHLGENPRRQWKVPTESTRKFGISSVRFWAALAILVVVLLIVAAVWAYRSISLPFETISKYSTDNEYKISTPALFIFASKSDVIQPVSGLQYPAQVNEPLMAVDYRPSIAILVLREYGNRSFPEVNVLWVGHQGNRVIVLTEFKNPSPWQNIPPMMGSSYQMILIPRDNLEGELRFSLFVGLREVAATTRRLP